jgi:hypothetical protein
MLKTYSKEERLICQKRELNVSENDNLVFEESMTSNLKSGVLATVHSNFGPAFLVGTLS